MLAKKFTSPEFWSSSSRTWRETGKQSRPWLKIGTFVFAAWSCVSLFGCHTLIGMPSIWFHCGLAFFSRIFVQTWERKAKPPELGRVILSCVPECWRRFQDVTRTVLPAKWISTSGSTRFFLLLSNPSICLIPSMKASSTADSKRARNISISVFEEDNTTVNCLWIYFVAGLQLWRSSG